MSFSIFTSDCYRYGYQGQFAEEDEETGWNAFELRMYDSRIGRWMTPDPAKQFHSPYLAMGNNWMNFTDPRGDTIRVSYRTGFLGIFGPQKSMDYHSGYWYDGNGDLADISDAPQRVLNQMGDINQLYSDSDGRTLLDYLSSHSEIISVKYSSKPRYNRATNTLSFGGTPSVDFSSLQYGGSSDPPPSYIVLGHEVWHAFSDLSGVRNPEWYDYGIGIDEIGAVHFENILRSRAGLDLIHTYSTPETKMLNNKQSIYIAVSTGRGRQMYNYSTHPSYTGINNALPPYFK